MSNPAPGSLETVRTFVNTLDIDDAVELLSTPAELVAWLAEHDLLSGAESARPTGARRGRAPQWRGALPAHLLPPPGQALPAGAVATPAAASRRARLTV